MQARVVGQSCDHDGMVIRMGPVNRELAGVMKSEWNLNRSSFVNETPSSSKKKFGWPAGGAVVPSQCDGKSEKSIGFRLKQTAVAGAPDSMAVGTKAPNPAPAKSAPRRKKINGKENTTWRT